MKKIESYEQCNLLIKNFKKNHGRLISNFFFLPKELKAVIADKEILYREREDSLVFCIEEEDFSHIFYFAEENACPELENTGKRMILDLIARKTSVPTETSREEKLWQSAGFGEYKQYIRLRYDIEKEFYAKMNAGQHKDYILSSAEPIDGNAVLNLWRTVLDRYSSPLPGDADMERVIKSGHVYAAKKNDIVIGAVYMETASKSCVLKHLAVDSSCRRQGLGTALINCALKAMASEHIERCFLWVDVNNTPAYESYKKYGFEEEGLWSKQLIR